MSALSREIAKWLQSNPGMLVGPDAANVWLQAKMKFVVDRRWRQEFDMATFMQHMNSVGYRMEHRAVHSGGLMKGQCVLALPARHKGF